MKRFVAPVLREEQRLIQLTQGGDDGGVISCGLVTCPPIVP